jgi:hypothetical protein
MADDIWVLDDFGADSAREIRMNVTAADADDCDLQEDIVVVFYGGLRQIDYFYSPDARQHCRLHSKFSGKSLAVTLLLQTTKYLGCL